MRLASFLELSALLVMQSHVLRDEPYSSVLCISDLWFSLELGLVRGLEKGSLFSTAFKGETLQLLFF